MSLMSNLLAFKAEVLSGIVFGFYSDDLSAFKALLVVTTKMLALLYSATSRFQSLNTEKATSSNWGIDSGSI